MAETTLISKTSKSTGTSKHSLLNRVKDADPEVVMKKAIWNLVLLLLGLLIGFIIIQHAMFYSFPPNLDAFIYIQKEVYFVFSLLFLLSVRTLSYVESKLRGLTSS